MHQLGSDIYMRLPERIEPVVGLTDLSVEYMHARDRMDSRNPDEKIGGTDFPAADARRPTFFCRKISAI